MNDQELKKLLKKLQVIMRCPNCGKRYIAEEIAMRGFIDQTYFLHLDCSSCHVPVFATIAISGDNKKDIENDIDLQQNQEFEVPKEFLKEKESKITDTDIKEFSESIDNFSGSFSKEL